MANKGRINFGIGFNVDKTGLNELRASLQSIQNLTPKEILSAKNINDARAKLNSVKESAKTVESALAASFNPKLSTYNIDKFNKTLQGSGIALQNLKTEWESIGATGKKTFNDLTNAITAAKLPLEETHSLLKSMGVTLANTIKWSIASSAINSLTGSVQKAWSFTKQLDESLNNIMIVTGKSSDQMAVFARQANSAAKALGSTTKAYTDAALIYYQQGLSENDVAARAGVTIKAANVTGQSAETVSEQLTAVWNGYKVSAQEAEIYIDKLAAVAASTAADLEELSVGMSQVASAANIMGVDIDQLNAQLATIVSVTREAPETIGTALKTVYARMSDIESGLDTETTLGAYTSEMAEFGIRVLDGNNKLRDMGEVVEEIGNKWSTFSREQRVALAQTVAGTRQYARMMSLFDNWEMYQQALETSVDSVGTLAEQEEIYLESIEAHMNKMTASAENLYMQIFDPEGVADLYSLLSGLIDLGADFVESLGGGGKMLLAALPLIAKLLSGPVSSGLATFVTNLQTAEQKSLTLKSVLENIASVKAVDGLKAYQDKIVELRKQITLLANAGVITNTQYNELTETLTRLSESASEEDFGEEASKKAEAKILQYQTVFGAQGGTLDYNKLREQGQEFASTGRDAKTDQSWQTDEYEKFNKVLNSTKEKINELKNNSNDAFQKIKSDFVEGTQTAKTFEDQLTAIDKEINELTDANGLMGSDLRSVNAQRKKLEAALNGTSVDGKRTLSTKERQKNIDDAIAALRSRLGSAADAVIKEVEGMRKQVGKDAQGATEEISQGVEAGLYSFEQRIKKLNLEQSINKIINFTSNVGMAISAVSLLAEQKNIWTNEDLTIGEKITQSLMNFTSAAGMLLPIIKLIHDNYNSMNIAAAKTVALNWTQLSQEELKEKLSKANLNEEKKELLIKKLQNKELDEETLQELMTLGVLKDQTKELLKQQALEKAKQVGSFLLKMGPYAAIVAVAIAALAAGIAATTSVINEEEKALKEATEAAEHASAKYQETQSAWESLQNSISSYQEAKKSIEELTEGTVEWREAIHAANDEVLSLLEKYPELNAYLTRDVSTGALSISQRGLEKVQEEQQEEISNARSRSLLAQQAQETAEFNLKQKELADTLIYGSEAMADFVDGYTIALNVVGSPIVAYGMQSSIDLAEDKYAESLTQYFDLYATGLHDDMFTSVNAFESAVGEVADEEKELAEKLVENSAAVTALAEEYRINKQANATRLEELGYEILGDKDASRGEAYVTGQKATNRQAEIYEELKDELGGNAYDKNVAKRYAEIMGYDANTIDTSGHNVFTIEINGKRSEKISLAKAYSEMAAELARQEAGNKKEAEAVKEFTNSFKQLNKEERNALSTLVEGEALVDYSKLTFGGIENLTNIKTTTGAFDTLAESLGIAKEELEKWHSAELGAILTERKEVVSNLPTEIQNSFKKVLSDVSGITLSTYQAFGKTYAEIWDRFGAEGLAAVSKMMVAAGDKADNLLEELSEVDWASDDIKENIQSVLDNLGLSIDIDIVDNYIEQMQYLNNVYGMSRDKMHEVAASIENILDNLKIGDIIKEEDYNQLELYLGDLSDKFIQLANGSYQLIDGNTTLSKLEQERQRRAARANINAQNQKVDDAYTAATLAAEAENARQDASEKEADARNKASKATFVEVNEGSLQYKNGLSEDQIINAIVDSGAYKNVMPWANDTDARAALKGLINQIGNTINTPEEIQAIANQLNEMFKKTEAAWLSIPTGQRANELVTRAAELEGKVADLGYEGKTRDEILASAEELKKELPDLYKDYLATASTFDEIVTISQAAADAGVKIEESDLLNKIKGLSHTIFSTIEDNALLSADQLYSYFEQAWNDAVDAGEVSGDKIEDISELQGKSVEDVTKVIAKSFEDLIKGTRNLDRAIENINEELELLESQFEDSSGADAIKNLNDQIKLLNDGIELANQKLKDLKDQYRNNLPVAVDTFYSELEKINLSVTWEKDWLSENLIDSEGNVNQNIVENLESLSIAFQAQMNTDAQAVVDSLLAYVNRYEEGLKEAERSAAEYQRKQLEKNFEAFELRLDKLTSLDKFNKELNEYEKKFFEEDQHLNFSNTYIDDITASINLVGTYSKKLEELNTLRENGSISQKKYVEEYEEILKSIQDEQLSILEANQALEEERLNALDDISNAYEKQVDYLEQINSLLETQKSTIELVYGEDSYELLNVYYEGALNNALKIEQSARDRFAAASLKYQPGSETWAQLSKEEQEAIVEEYYAAGEAAAEAMYSSMEVRRDKYLNDTEIELNKFNKSIYKDFNIELWKEQWQWAKDSMDGYYDSVQRLYKIEDLDLEFKKTIYDNSDVKAQQAINKLRQEELAYLKSLDKLSEYDVKRAQQKLEILQAEIALRDAEAAKTEMRLVRGADGTYSYQYTANQDAITKARDELNQAQSDLYDLDLEEYTSSIDKFTGALEDLEDIIRKLGEDGFTEDEMQFIKSRWEEIARLAEESNRINQNHFESMTNAASTFGVNLSTIVQGTVNTLSQDIDKIINEVATNGIQGSFDLLMSNLTQLSNNYLGQQKLAAQELEEAIGKPGTDGVGGTGLIGALENEAKAHDTVIGKYQTEYDELIKLLPQISELSKGYDDVKWSVDRLTDAYENLAAAKAAAGEDSGSDDGGNENNDDVHELPTYEKVENGKWKYTGSNTQFSDDSKIGNVVSEKDKQDNGLNMIEYNGKTVKAKDLYDILYEKGDISPETTFDTWWSDQTRPLNVTNTDTAPTTPQNDNNTDTAPTTTPQDDSADYIYGNGALKAVGTWKFASGATYKDDIIVSGVTPKVYWIGESLDEGALQAATNNVIDGADADDPAVLNVVGLNHNYYKDRLGQGYVVAKLHKGDYVFLPTNLMKFQDNPSGPLKKGDSWAYSWSSFDTGGYTGSWGDPSGRLAVLHEKEIVLNKADTANLLKAVDIVRTLESNMLNSLSQMRFGYGASMAAWELAKEMVIEQNVHITAEFPNVNSKEEIEEAFSDLINLATQHIYKNNR